MSRGTDQVLSWVVFLCCISALSVGTLMMLVLPRQAANTTGPLLLVRCSWVEFADGGIHLCLEAIPHPCVENMSKLFCYLGPSVITRSHC